MNTERKDQVQASENTEMNNIIMRDKGKRKALIIVVISAVLVLSAVIIIAVMVWGDNDKKLQEQLDLGARYLEEMNYEQALVAFNTALSIDPKNTDAYLGIVEVYIRTNEFESALETAREGYEVTGDERLKEKIDMIESGDIFASNGRDMKESDYKRDEKIHPSEPNHTDGRKIEEKDKAELKATAADIMINENEINYFEDDYDYDGIEEAFLITGEAAVEGGYYNVKIYFINTEGDVWQVNDNNTNYGYVKEGKLLDTGNSKFLVWELDAMGTGSLSILFGVKNGQFYEPQISRRYQQFWKSSENENYCGWIDYFGNGFHEYLTSYFDYDEITKEFVEITESSPGEEIIEFDEIIEEIRKCYYDIEDNISSYDTQITEVYIRYTYNNEMRKITLFPSEMEMRDMTEEFYYDEEGRLLFAFVHDSINEFRYYFYNGLIYRYIDNNGVVSDYQGGKIPEEIENAGEIYMNGMMERHYYYG